MIEIETSATNPAFVAAIEALRTADLRAELDLEQIPAPSKLATNAVAFAADVRHKSGTHQSDQGTGRFVLLHEPTAQESWGGNFRVVAFAKSPLDTFIGEDAMASQVAWAWLTDALSSRKAHYTHDAGTATRVISTGFGSLSDQSEHAEIELRVSWSPVDNFAAHIAAWQDLVCMMSGLPQLPTSVISLPQN